MEITEALETIINARYGREVRQAIHDGIKQAYEDGTANGNANMEVSQARGSYPSLAERLMNLDKVDRDNLNELMVLLAGRIKKGQVTMADLTQEVKEVLNGDRPLPIVGKDAVGTVNVIDNAITVDKIDNKSYTINIFDKHSAVEGYYSSSVGNPINFGNNSNWRTVKTKYPVKEGDVVRFSHAFQNGYFLGVDSNDVLKQMGTSKSTAQYVEVTVAAGVTAFYSNVFKDYLDVAMITINNAMPSNYTPYGLITKSLDWLKVEASNLGESAKALLNVSSKRSGEHWLVIGNSIAWQDGKPYTDGTIAKGWQTVLSETLGMTFDNRAISGSPIASGTANPGAGIEELKRITDFSQYDGVIIAHQTNDFKLNVPKGTLSSIKDTAPKDTTTFIGALEEAIEYIQNYNSNIPIVIETGIKRNNAGYDTESTNTVGLKQIDYVEALKEVANKYSALIVDTYFESGINEQTLDTDTRDGLHPNDKGYIKMARPYKRILENI